MLLQLPRLGLLPHSLAMCPGHTYLVTLSPSFLIFKMKKCDP